MACIIRQQTNLQVVIMRQFKLILLLSYLFAGSLNADESPGAKKIVADFYRNYLHYHFNKTPGTQLPELAFSNAFLADIEKNYLICTEYATGICGWNASGDEYLNTQETDPNLRYENSGVTFTEFNNNIIEVRLNLFPSTKDPYYDRIIRFNMIQENGKWVVDDIAYDEKSQSSVREYIRKENAEYLANPDPDSKAMKK
jgi:Protein of unknown function (DUF3828)